MAIGLRSKKLLAIDWDKKSLRMAVVRHRGDGIELLKAVSVPVPSEVVLDDAESFGAFLREAMRQSRLGVKQAALCIPRAQVVLNTLNLPPTPIEEMAALVQFQIVKELPFSADQATIDFALAPGHDPKQPCIALVAAIREEDLAFYRKVAQEAGLSIARIGLRPHANLRAVVACLPDLMDQSALVVEVGPMLTEIDIVRSGALVFSRAASVPLPALNVRDADRIHDSRIAMASVPNVDSDEVSRGAVNSLMVDVIRSFEAYRATDPEVGIDQIVVCGATGLEAQLADCLAARFAARAQLFSPDRALELSPQRGKDLRGFSAALGLAMGQGTEPFETFDFLNPKKPISKRSLRLKKAPAGGLAAAFLVAAYFAYDYRFFQPLAAEVAVLEASVAELDDREEPLRAFKDQVDAVVDWKASDQNWPLLLAKLTEVLPGERDVYLTDLDFRTQTKRKSNKRIHELTIKFGESRYGMVHKITEDLRAAGFDPVQFVSEMERTGGDPKAEPIYSADARVDAGIPDGLFSKSKAKGGGPVRGSAGESDTPPTRSAKKPADMPAEEPSPNDAKESAPNESAPKELDGGSDAEGAKAAEPKQPARPTPARRATPRGPATPSPRQAPKRSTGVPSVKKGGLKR